MIVRRLFQVPLEMWIFKKMIWLERFLSLLHHRIVFVCSIRITWQIKCQHQFLIYLFLIYIISAFVSSCSEPNVVLTEHLFGEESHVARYRTDFCQFLGKACRASSWVPSGYGSCIIRSHYRLLPTSAMIRYFFLESNSGLLGLWKLWTLCHMWSFVLPVKNGLEKDCTGRDLLESLDVGMGLSTSQSHAFVQNHSCELFI